MKILGCEPWYWSLDDGAVMTVCRCSDGADDVTALRCFSEGLFWLFTTLCPSANPTEMIVAQFLLFII